MKFVTKRSLSRRRFLHGTSALIGLPLLDAMVPAFASDAPAVTRLGFFYLPYGVGKNFIGADYWTPRGEGRGHGRSGSASSTCRTASR